MTSGQGIRAILAGVVLAAAWPSMAAAQYSPLTRAEQVVCRGLDDCRDILLRHGPDEFDYAVLAARYQAFGPKGTAQLFQLLNSDRETAVTHAQYVLGQYGWRFTPDEQRQIAALWPVGDIEAHAQIMRRVGSPMMRNTAIATLSDKNPIIRQHSRDMLKAMAGLNFPLPPNAVMQLSRAAIDYPTPDIVNNLAALPASQSRPVLERVLLSGDAESVIEAYAALYDTDLEAAFKALLRSFENLQTPEQSFAIGEMLAHRHKSRADGFYMKLAKELAEDDAEKPLARLAGLHAVMISSGGGKTVKLDQAATLVPLRLALLNLEDGPETYSGYLRHNFSAMDAGWIAAFDTAYGTAKPRQGSTGYARFIANLAVQDTPQIRKITMAAMDNRTDYSVQIAGIISAAAFGMNVEPELSAIRKSHPITKVRLAADMMLEALEDEAVIDPLKTEAKLNGRQDESFLKALNKLNITANYCAIKAVDFTQQAKAMPFFAEAQIGKLPTARATLSSAVALRSGWLAGYDMDENNGGLLYYDYEIETAKNLLDENVIAIIPIAKVPLGQYAPAHWVVTSAGLPGNRVAHIYRLSQAGNGFDVRFHAKLPDRPAAILQDSNNAVLMGFHPTAGAKPKPKFDKALNPPLVLLPNGGITRACPDRSASAPAKALP